MSFAMTLGSGWPTSTPDGVTFQRAEREAMQAWDELERWRATLSDEELRVLAFQASPTEMNDRDAEVVRVVNELATRGRGAAAFELAERRRARELADQLAQAAALNQSDTSHPSPLPSEQSADPDDRSSGCFQHPRRQHRHSRVRDRLAGSTHDTVSAAPRKGEEFFRLSPCSRPIHWRRELPGSRP